MKYILIILLFAVVSFSQPKWLKLNDIDVKDRLGKFEVNNQL